MSERTYQISTGVWVIAECDRCGRGFVRIGPQSNGRDPFQPQRSDRRYFDKAPCNGRIVMLEKSEAHRAATGEDFDSTLVSDGFPCADDLAILLRHEGGE